MKAAIVVNPFSGGGRTGQMWAEIRDEVRARLGGIVEFTTSGPADATRFAREVAHSDAELLIVAGGDGTINEALNGLFTEKNETFNPKLALGILSAGRGSDFIRSVDIPSDYRQAVNLLLNPSYKKVDVGCAFFKDEFGREKKRFFINIAAAGLAGKVAKRVNHTPRFMPPELAYFGSVASCFLTTRPQKVKITVDKKVVFEGATVNTFIANGRYSGAGMCWAPMAKVDDGVFEIVVVEPMPKYKIIASAHRLYDGSFISMNGVHHFRGQSVLIESLEDVMVEIDGEQPGVLPLGCTLLPQALTVTVGSGD